MIGCLRTRVREQPIIALNFENELKLYNLEAWWQVDKKLSLGSGDTSNKRQFWEKHLK